MQVAELIDDLKSMSNGAPDIGTVDRVVVGDPAAEIRGVLVAWLPTREVLSEAVARSCNVIVTHEPTFHDHFDLDIDVERLASVRAKRAFIAEHGLHIVRCHDLWDDLPELGVRDSWARALDLGAVVERDGPTVVFEVPATTARLVARTVAARTKRFGQPAVQLIGSGDAVIRRIAVGTGAITPYFTWVRERSIDLAICTDDGIEYWREGAFAIDNDLPIIVVNHGAAEEAGMVALAEYLRSALAPTPVHHHPQGCMYKLVID